jgi:hypothetical protein
MVLLASIGLAFAASFAACKASSNTASPTADVAVSPSPVSTPTVDPDAIATRAAGSPGAALAAVLFVDGDLPADMHALPSQSKILQPRDAPGLIATASGASVTIVSDDKNEFVTEIGIIPDTDSPQALLDAFSLANYLTGFTGGASDAVGTALVLPAAPPGAKAFSYSGTVRSAGQTHVVEGEAVAFAHGNVFVILAHGRYVSSTRAIDLGALAATIDGRLVSTNQ